MSRPFVWWENRKSRMGLKPSAKQPPHHPNGKEWWTTPPIALPEPAYIEYVAAYHAELLATICTGPKDKRAAAQSMQKYVTDWMRAARRLMHERAYEFGPADLHKTDGLIEAADHVLSDCLGFITSIGRSDWIKERTRQVQRALQGRAAQVRRARSVDPTVRTETLKPRG